MLEQTKRNAGYLAGLCLLKGIAEKLGWGDMQFETARAELIRQLSPTLAEI